MQGRGAGRGAQVNPDDISSGTHAVRLVLEERKRLRGEGYDECKAEVLALFTDEPNYDYPRYIEYLKEKVAALGKKKDKK